MSDRDSWEIIDGEDLWIYDKLLLAKRLGYCTGPAGIRVPTPGWYIVKPIYNLRMMSRGAHKAWLDPEFDTIPDGYFWTELFTGRHITIDYNYGIQKLTAEGFRIGDRYDRFARWDKVEYPFTLPAILQPIANKYEWLNVELIGGKIIEVHLRYNDDFANHNGATIIPVWKDSMSVQPPNTTWYDSPCGDRLGFWVK